ncbi:MAG: 2-succinyl-5-enolpyruvyl-6-hydroxy-3-cyclohexene-carboxylate synthase [Solirubrobacteraceae bacterium]|jgi:2-succinyl-5-enolpyruvyl-6-hydroxy-3-cyclohexene-1-carboxylate synthase|nr:2-succinyl-5-enolpyruvyl-6-hydroxy-3-cyclohexene-carboxylate synthase [Solirubrobacteraceae bacterium]
MTATDTYRLLRAFCDELARCGLQHACTSPGSRSTPIVLSLAREPRIRTYSHVDERCAAFFALGAAKASGRPVALACTSGTAAAHYAPAIIEARWARVPLIVLTADRPPELRDVGAGQTINQLGLYSDAVKWFVEVGVDEARSENLRWMRALACRAYWTALEHSPGPVHLNFPLREPLVLDDPLPVEEDGGRPKGRPWVSRPRVGAPAAAALELPEHGVVVAGREEHDGALADAVVGFAARAGYPLLADPLSGARRGPAAIAHYDLLLRDPGFAEGMRPELIIRTGDLPTSKPLRTWLAGLGDVRQVALDPEAGWQDPAAVVSERLAVDPSTTLNALTPSTEDPEWLARWRAADTQAAAVIERELADELTEPVVARRLAQWLGPEATLFVASSMPIRDLETFMPVRDGAPRMLSNRGTNGIDGTVSSAFGAVAAGSEPVVLLIGDIALAHDLGGLLAARRLGLSLTIVLINNDGGGIFHFLPVAGQTDAFEEHVATPHGLRFSLAAELYGCAYESVSDLDGLRGALQRALRAPGTSIVEVPSAREANVAVHRRVAAAVTDAVSAASR